MTRILAEFVLIFFFSLAIPSYADHIRADESGFYGGVTQSDTTSVPITGVEGGKRYQATSARTTSSRTQTYKRRRAAEDDDEELGDDDDDNGGGDVDDGGDEEVDDSVAQLRVRLSDEDAKVFIEGQRTRSTGGDRLYVSPPLEDTKSTYWYTVKIRLSDGTEQTISVDVKPGETTTIRERNGRLSTDRPHQGGDNNTDPNLPPLPPLPPNVPAAPGQPGGSVVIPGAVPIAPAAPAGPGGGVAVPPPAPAS